MIRHRTVRPCRPGHRKRSLPYPSVTQAHERNGDRGAAQKLAAAVAHLAESAAPVPAPTCAGVAALLDDRGVPVGRGRAAPLGRLGETVVGRRARQRMPVGACARKGLTRDCSARCLDCPEPSRLG